MVMGIHIIFHEPFIFAKWKDWVFNKLPFSPKVRTWIFKPLVNCPVCMSSVWGTIFYIYFYNQIDIPYLVYVISLAGLIFVVHLLAMIDPRK